MDDFLLSDKVLNILSLEDNLRDYELICLRLQGTGLRFEISRVDNESDFSNALGENSYDIILADFNLPTYDAFRALKLANETRPDIPFICLSGSIGEETAIELLKMGAVDYVLKDRPERLPFAIKRALDEQKEKDVRKKAEKALLQSEENFRHSISESPLGIRIVTTQGETIYTNKAFLELFELSSMNEFLQMRAKDRYTPESYQQHLERKKTRMSGNDIQEYELSMFGKNQDIRYVKVSRKEVQWNGSKHYQVINQDITEQKNLTIDLIRAKERAVESDRLKSAFLANMSHEIRTPMNGILGFAGLLKETDLTEEMQQSYINIIEKSGKRLLNIINDLIDISKIEAGQMNTNLSETDIYDVVEYIHSFFQLEAEQKGLELTINQPTANEHPIVVTDQEKLYAILSNLTKNAIKFTPTGSIQLGYTITSGDITFYIKDTGIGIHSEQKDIIFQRFRQGSENLSRDYEGAGLGLSISKAYVEMLGGKIWVESEFGLGSTFYFSLPTTNFPTQHDQDR